MLLSGEEEGEINDYFVESAFPSRKEVEQVLAALHTVPGGLSINELMVNVNASWGRLNKAVQLLSLESPAPIVKQGSKWRLTTATLAETFWQRAERLTALRRVEQEQMQQYVGLPSGHMEFLIRALDGDPGQFHPPNLPALPRTANEALVRDAVAFLRRTSLPLEPRQKWPAGGLPQMDVRGNIQPERQMRAGRILCVWGDA